MPLPDWCSKTSLRQICYYALLLLFMNYVMMVKSYHHCAFLYSSFHHRKTVPSSSFTVNLKRNWNNALIVKKTRKRTQIVSLQLLNDEGSMEMNQFNHSKANNDEDIMEFDELLEEKKKEEESLYEKRNTKYFSEQLRHSLELHWSIQKANEDCDLEDITSCSEPCPDCRGTGLVICRFCDGVGYLDMGPQLPGTIGKALLKDRMGVECPVCNEDAEQVCETCMGSGWIANWRKTVSGINQMNSTNYNSFTP